MSGIVAEWIEPQRLPWITRRTGSDWQARMKAIRLLPMQPLIVALVALRHDV